MIRPVTMLETSRPPTIAIDIRPASVGLMPRAIWKYCAEVDRRAEHRDADQHGGDGGERRGAVLEQAQRDDRLDGDPRLDVQRGGDDQRGRRRPARRSWARSRRTAVPARETQTSRMRDAADDQGGAEVVDLDRALDDRQVQRLLEHDEREHARPGRPTKKQPRQPSGESTIRPPMSGPLTVASANDRADVAGVAAALARAHHRGDDDLHQGGEAADAEALDDAGADQDLHVRREAPRSASRRCRSPAPTGRAASC